MVGILAVFAGVRYFPAVEKNFTRENKIGMVGRFSAGNLPHQVSELISYGLTRTLPSGKAEPALAESFEANEEGTEFTFKIDTSKQWSDHSPVKSTDLGISIENVAVEVPDEETIIFKLADPYAPFGTLVSRPVFKNGLVGLGPGEVVSVKKNGEFIEEMTVRTPERERIKFKFYRTSSDLTVGFKLGEVDEMWGLTGLDWAPEREGLEITDKLNLDIYSAVFFNTADDSLADKTFRQALVYAIPDKPAGDKRALSPISPLSFAYNPGVKPYDTNLKTAKELLGESLGETEAPVLELTTTLPFLSVAEKIAAAWTELGVKTTVKVATVIPENFQALLIGQERPADPDQYSLWHSTQKSNITRYSSPKADKLLEDGRKTMDENARLTIYRDFQRFLVEDSPAAFLEHLTTYNVKRKFK